jgi:hypothetical protein
MDREQREALARQACWDGVIDMECPVCGALIAAEPDADELYCEQCEKRSP